MAHEVRCGSGVVGSGRSAKSLGFEKEERRERLGMRSRCFGLDPNEVSSEADLDGEPGSEIYYLGGRGPWTLVGARTCSYQYLFII